jgi:hypothetical protein
MKKSTVFILVLAIAAALGAYYFDWKKGEKEAATASDESSKPAFTFQPDDVQSLSISYPDDPKGRSVSFEKRDGSWQMTHPIDTSADALSVGAITQGLAAARISQTEPGAPDRLKVFGLDPPAVDLDFQLKSGAKHSVQMGKKDFTGTSVYAIVDHAKDVALLPESLLASSDRPVEELRDRNVLHVDTENAASFDLKNSSGEVVAAKGKAGWNISRPSESAADVDAVNSLLSAISVAKLVSVQSETADDLAKYGLTDPSITFTTGNSTGKTATLIVGKKDGDEYFARDESRPTIFRINADLYKKLSQTYADLRDKKIAQFDSSTVTQVEIHDANGTMACSRKDESQWVFDAPADQKGKSASPEKIFTALDQARADQIYDRPPADIAARLAKPAFEATLTTQDGKKITVSVSKAAGDFVYARNSDGPAIYKLKKQILDSLNVKPSDLTF